MLSSRKDYMALYLMAAYPPAVNAWFRAAYQATGKKLDMGKACVRFRTVDDLALDVIGEMIAKVPVDAYVAAYHQSREGTAKGKATQPAKSKPAKPAARKTKPAKQAKSPRKPKRR